MTGSIGIRRDTRAYELLLRDLDECRAELREKALELETFQEVAVSRELKMIALEREVEKLRRELESLRAEPGRA